MRRKESPKQSQRQIFFSLLTTFVDSYKMSHFFVYQSFLTLIPNVKRHNGGNVSLNLADFKQLDHTPGNLKEWMPPLLFWSHDVSANDSNYNVVSIEITLQFLRCFAVTVVKKTVWIIVCDLFHIHIHIDINTLISAKQFLCES